MMFVPPSFAAGHAILMWYYRRLSQGRPQPLLLMERLEILRPPTAALKAIVPIPRSTLTEAAFEKLISHVVSGDWKAGDRIPPERELCQQLGIARTSLREALKAMELIGMLDSRVGDGTFVCERSEFLSRPLLWAFTGNDHLELRDIMEARTLLEEQLAGLAAERASDAEIETIGQLVRTMAESVTQGKSILDEDMKFHLTIAAAAHNQILQNAVQLLRNLMRQWIHFKLLIPNVPATVLKRHQAIYRAIRDRDPQSARAAMREHLEETISLVARLIAQHQATER
jgi:GntR family transcriptional repressor for pyruvate dehydrogenase complex